MNTALTVFLKEVRDNLRDRRTLLMALVFGPILGPVLLVVLMKAGISQSMEGGKELPLVVIGAQHAPNLVQRLIEHGAEIERSSDAPETIIADDKDAVVLVIPAGIADYYREARTAKLQVYFDQSERAAERRTNRLGRILEAEADLLGMQRLQARGISPDVVRPYVVEEVDLSTPMSRAAMVFSMLPYFLLLATIMGSFYLAIDTTAGERERGSLESLLSLPLSRAEIVIGKIGAAVVFSTLSLLLTAAMFAVAFPQLELDSIGIRTSLGIGQVLGIIGVMLPFALFSAGMLTLIASYAKSYKEAQTYLSLVMLVPVIPVIAGALMGADLSVVGALVPGFSQHLLVMEIIKGAEVPLLYFLCSAGATLAAGAGMTAGAVWLYRSERILG